MNKELKYQKLDRCKLAKDVEKTINEGRMTILEGLEYCLYETPKRIHILVDELLAGKITLEAFKEAV